MKIYKLNQSNASDCEPGSQESAAASGQVNANGKGAPHRCPGLPLPVGIDLHPDIFDAVELRQGKRSKDATVERRFRELPTVAIVEWATKQLDPEKNMLIIESTSNTLDCVIKLVDAGFSCVVIEGADTSQLAEAYIDNDQLAAERIGRWYLTGYAKVVWQPDPKTRERREILHSYDRAVNRHVRATNELKSFLTTRNVRPKNRNLHLEKNRKWVEDQLEDLSPNQQVILEAHFASLHAAKANRDLFYHVICKEMLAEPQMLSCLRVIGIGMINAFAIVALVGDINRFANAKKLVSYFGLNPGRKKSGNGKDKKKGTGNRGRRDMRALLVQAAQSVLKKARADKYTLAKWGFKLFARTGNRHIAVIAIARKLTTALYYILSGRGTNMLEQREPMRRKFCKLSAEIGKEGRKALGLPEKRADFITYLYEKIGWPEEQAKAK